MENIAEAPAKSASRTASQYLPFLVISAREMLVFYLPRQAGCYGALLRETDADADADVYVGLIDRLWRVD